MYIVCMALYEMQINASSWRADFNFLSEISNDRSGPCMGFVPNDFLLEEALCLPDNSRHEDTSGTKASPSPARDAERCP